MHICFARVKLRVGLDQGPSPLSLRVAGTMTVASSEKIAYYHPRLSGRTDTKALNPHANSR
eukprot:scaffold42336_cov36-Tisochrysis_lutea.AAC.3